MDAALLDRLLRLQPLASLGEEHLRELLPYCQIERVARNLDPFRLRDWGQQVMYLLRGELKLDFADGSMDVLVGGSGDALLPIVKGGHCPVGAKAITDVDLLCVNEDALDIVITWNQVATSGHGAPAVSPPAPDWRSFKGLLAARNLTQGAFASLPPAHIESLLGRFQRVVGHHGQAIIHQGELGDYYYVIERGRCRVTRQVAGVPMEVAELKAGDAFGEEALVTDTVRNATVTMKTDGILLRLDKTDFVALLREPLLQRLSPEEARRRVAAGALWLDVRFSAEFRHDGLAGAINIPLDELREFLATLDPRQEYVAYCQTGRRSSAAAFLLSQRGIRASLLEGGMKALFATGDR